MTLKNENSHHYKALDRFTMGEDVFSTKIAWKVFYLSKLEVKLISSHR